jgi:hypothetical protein
MTRQLDSAFSLKALSSGRAAVLAAFAVLLVVADWWPDNDRLEFLLTLAVGAWAIGIAFRDRAEPADLVRWRNRLILLTFTMTLMIFAAELATRWVFRDVTTSAGEGGYFSQRWLDSSQSEMNAAGFRGRAYTDAKPAGTYRIAVVGDSFTYANGVRMEDRYSDIIQRRLPAQFEVLNFGVPGANTPQHRQRVAALLDTIHPDFILLQWYVNDMEGDSTEGRPTFRPLLPWRGVHTWLGDHSAFYNIANVKWAEMQVMFGMTTSYLDYMEARLRDPNGVDAQTNQQQLRDLIARSQKAGVPIGIVLFPDTAAPITDTYPFGYLHDRVLDVCAEAHLTCLDLRKDFALVKDHRELWASRLDHHPSARANAIAAERILETYSRQWAASPK